jgi:hypothetical protein
LRGDEATDDDGSETDEPDEAEEYHGEGRAAASIPKVRRGFHR